jgi:Ni/Fe-hydrogenase subunit HybB-like protein
MAATNNNSLIAPKKGYLAVVSILIIIGAITFFMRLAGDHPERAWQAYLINFLLFSGIAQGALLFSTLMHTTRARWSGPLSNIAESFTAFFPVSFILFILLFFGRDHIFPWLHQNLHGKEIWLNVPFLFFRNFIGLLILYGLGMAYLYHALWFKLEPKGSAGKMHGFLRRRWERNMPDADRYHRRMTVLAFLYMLAFAIILSLIGYDLVMAADPHWYSTLFGAYTFVKAFYVGLGGVIILAAILHLNPRFTFGLQSSQFHDIGKLFFAFCLVWADFFYCQFVVIWYGNISEETAYIIERTMQAPWNTLAWFVFIVCFILPFIILLNRKIKTNPIAMAIICSAVIIGIWLEHFLLLGPAFSHDVSSLPMSVTDVLITLGFLGLMILAVSGFLTQFPEITTGENRQMTAQEVI